MSHKYESKKLSELEIMKPYIVNEGAAGFYSVFSKDKTDLKNYRLRANSVFFVIKHESFAISNSDGSDQMHRITILNSELGMKTMSVIWPTSPEYIEPSLCISEVTEDELCDQAI